MMRHPIDPGMPELEPEPPKSDKEYLENYIKFIFQMRNTGLEKVRNGESLIMDLKEDLKKIKTPELIAVANNMIKQQEVIKGQGLELIKQCRTDLMFLNSIFKKVKNL